MEIANISILAALAAGAVSFLSPCVLPLVPGYLSYVAGSLSADSDSPRARISAFAMSFWFVLGFSTVFVILGAGASALSRLLLSYRYEAGLVGGAIIVVFGIFSTGVVRIPWMEREFRLSPQVSGGRPQSAYILGLAFGFGWTPCIGPILGAILTVSATSTTPAAGVALLAIYSLGLAIPFLLTALLAGGITARLRRLRSFGRGLQIFTGLTMVAMGLAMMTGRLSTMAFWLLETFPILALIG
ncbi:MAG: cytochrome c biogenesis protein CcdA [Bosea sp.]|uniref:cytochrome c biogenesis CcdA family protein n=1 Tax=unclassified Bosea (in: a-proteobacteria) TaxID=2653178 RepID=UPI00096262D1|nr:MULTISPECIES: cytochrome c biogenesis protein CcdA [unclassified Bosea (in: a-proteobacteria)]MBN9459310.1 cytochrome c biogenesis protein CcdA [Bosea sp. (in: a-proteobacteria)]OJV04551.1 MAG: cytochrome C biogenesis protein [Bosea sp. 67-29]